ncbi:hypothetical protein MY10362_002539 [Beauveria mimosiformis]
MELLRAKINRVGVEVLMADNPTQYGYHHGENLVISSVNTQVCDVVVTAQGEIAIKRWVLDGWWRRARYINEPRKLHPDSLIMQYADSLELVAERCVEFKDMFGADFHRPGIAQESSSEMELPIR